MVLDECTEYPASYKRSKKNPMELSLEWAAKSKKKFRRRIGYGIFWNYSRVVCLTI